MQPSSFLRAPQIFALLTLVFVLAVRLAQGQSVYGTIVGTVTDPSGAAVQNATVSATDVDKGARLTATTNDSGNYTVNQLTPGRYRIEVTAPGFRNFVQENVAVGASLSARIDAALTIGRESDQVTVTDAPPALQTDRSEVNTTLSAKQISDLPVLNRNFTNITLVAPGTVLNTYQHAVSENPQQSTLTNTNGQNFSGTNYLLDGMNNNDQVLGIVMVNPAVESVGEVTFATSNYDAEYSQAGGAVVRIQTKSGTNELHGTAFDYLQNNVFQARDPFTQGLHDPGTPEPDHRGLPPLRWNLFGGSLGGPIVKNKIFAFAEYEATRRRFGGSESLRVPTQAERNGDLSALGGPLLPASQLSVPAQNVLALLPLPNVQADAPGDNNLAVNSVEKWNTDQGVIRVDHAVSEKLNYFARYNYLSSSVNAPGPFGLYGGPAIPQFGFSGKSDAQNHNGTASASYTFSPSLLTNVRFGFSRYDVTVNSLDANTNLAEQVGIPGINLASLPGSGGLPRLTINGTGGVTIGYDCNCPLHERETLLDFVNDWTKVAGNHTFRWGGTVELAWNLRLPSDQRRSGIYTFSGTVNGLSASNDFGLADFLLGQPNQFSRFTQITTDQQDRQNRMFYFAQDQWRVTPKLTLNLGVRWDVWFPDYSLNKGEGGRYDVVTNFVQIPGIGDVSRSGNAQTQYRNISPRISFAYAATDKTVVRGGYGRSYYPGTFGWTFNNLNADVYPSVISQQVTPVATNQAVFPLNQAPPTPVFPTVPSNGLLPLAPGISNGYIPPNLKIPSVDQYNITVEHQFVGGVVLSAGYVGNLGRHLNGGFQLNAGVPGPGDLNPNRPLFQKFGLTQSIGEKCNCTSSNFNSLQVQASKRLSSNVSFNLSFTWQKALDFGSFGLVTNQYNARQDYGPSDFDRTYAVAIQHTVVLPFGKGQHWGASANRLVNGVLGGWQFNGFSRIYSGLPFSPTLSTSASLNAADQTTRADVFGDPTAGINQDRNLWYNPAAFAIPAPFTFGSAGRNSLRGPWNWTADWSLFKVFPIHERVNLQARWEVFNVFNATNLALPQTNVNVAQAGRITDIQQGFPMRNMQLSLRLNW